MVLNPFPHTNPQHIVDPSSIAFISLGKGITYEFTIRYVFVFPCIIVARGNSSVGMMIAENYR